MLSKVSVAPDWLWTAFVISVVILLFIDLALFGGSGTKGHSRKKALIESGLWISIALCFYVWFSSQFGVPLGLEFLTGYLVEKSLSVDNLFVILLIFKSFKIPNRFQHKVLFFGVLGAIILRAIFILVGAKLVHSFHWVLYIFGVILVVTGIRFLFDREDDVEVEDHWAIRILRKFIPLTSTIKDQSFFIVEEGVKKATPLLVALLVVEFTDVVFAVDSIPAVFAVTKDAFVAFSSNILAILGLRALYFVLADWVSDLRYLKPGLAAILCFIGIKMLIADFFFIPSWVSLMVISGVLITAALSSWYVGRVEEENQKHEQA